MSGDFASISTLTDPADIAPVATLAGPVRVWTFAGAGPQGARGFNGDRDFPGPVFEFTEGEAAAIAFTNLSQGQHSLHIYGADETLQKSRVTSTAFVVPSMGSKTLRFVAPPAGTYFYYSHVDTPLQMEMGLYGALIVRPANGASHRAWEDGPAFDREYLWQLNTFDTRWHTAAATERLPRGYRPDVFMINGKDGAAAQSDPATAITGPQGAKVLVRLISYGQMPADVDFDDVPFKVIAADGRPVKRKVTGRGVWRINPGERYDLLLTLPAAGLRQATVTYRDIRDSRPVGAVRTLITST